MSKDYLTAAQLHPQARGRWLDILRYCCPGMFDEAIANLGSHVTCPFHGGEEDFRFIKKPHKGKETTADCGAAMCTCGKWPDGFALIHHVRGGRFIDTLREVNEYLNGSAPAKAPLPARPVTRPPNDAEIEAEARRFLKISLDLWVSGLNWTLDQVPYYLERGIDPRVLEGLQNVRFIPKLRYSVRVKATDKKASHYQKVDDFPAFLAKMQMPDDSLVAVHRTWLSHDRRSKAPVAKAKKLSLTPGCAGAAIRLFDAKGSTILGLSEGIETAFAARQLAWGRYWPELGKMPVWACYSEQNIRNFIIPPSLLETLETIVIFADNDKNGVGYSAACELKERLAVTHPHIVVIIKVPQNVGEDWNDVLVSL
ncbi:DUF7146 domain-containing protein [Comamonas thiooxydans]|uniref:DUF7146 domain-containing protein n=1 Tax=Comamonas thiooxydans TaxID=363952 RepID=UPI000B4103D6|nr:toprim domain-containing protein [Comamonas thiooxydans]